MNYYASYQRSSVPKWMVVTLGGVFTLIIMVCAVMIVDLLRPAKRAAQPIVAAAAAQPEVAATAPAPATAAVAKAAPVPAPSPSLVTASAVQPAAVNARPAKKHATRSHKHSVLAKRDGKSRSAKSDIDRLLGL